MVRLFFFSYLRLEISEPSNTVRVVRAASKIFAAILIRRLWIELGHHTGLYQIRFELGRRCADQMHNIRLTLEQCWSYQECAVMYVDDDILMMNSYKLLCKLVSLWSVFIHPFFLAQCSMTRVDNDWVKRKGNWFVCGPVHSLKCRCLYSMVYLVVILLMLLCVLCQLRTN